MLFSQSLVELDLDKSYISYDGKHPAHNWTGISNEIQGSFELNIQDLTLSKIDLYVPVFSFDSKNASRDSNMLDVVEEYYYPYVRFVSTKIHKKNNEFIKKKLSLLLNIFFVKFKNSIIDKTLKTIKE